MCWNNLDLSIIIAQLILEGIEKSNSENVGPYASILTIYLSMTDNI